MVRYNASKWYRSKGQVVARKQRQQYSNEPGVAGVTVAAQEEGVSSKGKSTSVVGAKGPLGW